MARIIHDFKVKKCKRWYKITYLNWFNDYVYVKDKSELNKLYKLSNEYCIKKARDSIIQYMDKWYVF